MRNGQSVTGEKDGRFARGRALRARRTFHDHCPPPPESDSAFSNESVHSEGRTSARGIAYCAEAPGAGNDSSCTFHAGAMRQRPGPMTARETPIGVSAVAALSRWDGARASEESVTDSGPASAAAVGAHLRREMNPRSPSSTHSEAPPVPSGNQITQLSGAVSPSAPSLYVVGGLRLRLEPRARPARLPGPPLGHEGGCDPLRAARHAPGERSRALRVREDLRRESSDGRAEPRRGRERR